MSRFESNENYKFLQKSIKDISGEDITTEEIYRKVKHINYCVARQNDFKLQEFIDSYHKKFNDVNKTDNDDFEDVMEEIYSEKVTSIWPKDKNSYIPSLGILKKEDELISYQACIGALERRYNYSEFLVISKNVGYKDAEEILNDYVLNNSISPKYINDLIKSRLQLKSDIDSTKSARLSSDEKMALEVYLKNVLQGNPKEKTIDISK